MRDNYEDSPAEARELGLRRLSRLTWRTAQLGALATVGFAIVFARTAPAPAANVQTVPSAVPPTAIAVPSRALGQPGTKPQGIASTHPGTRAGARSSRPQATQAAAKPSPQSAQAPAPSPSPSLAASHTLAPPATTPAPAPATSSPAPTATSTSHGGG